MKPKPIKEKKLDARRKMFRCLGCGKEQEGDINQKYCDIDGKSDHNCKYKALKANPIRKKAITISSPIRFGKGKIAFFEYLVEDSIGKTCRYCDTEIDLNNMSLDHITPFGNSEDRRHNEIKKKMDVEENLQIICKKCNSMKGELPHEKYVMLVDFLKTDKEIRDYVKRKLAQSTILWRFKRRLA